MKYPSNISAFFAAGLACVMAINCQDAMAQTSTKQKIDFIFTGYSYPYFAPMAAAIREISTYYPDLQIKIIDANNSPATQISDIKEAIADNVNRNHPQSCRRRGNIRRPAGDGRRDSDGYNRPGRGNAIGPRYFYRR